MKMMPTNSHAQLHVVGPRVAPRQAGAARIEGVRHTTAIVERKPQGPAGQAAAPEPGLPSAISAAKSANSEALALIGKKKPSGASVLSRKPPIAPHRPNVAQNKRKSAHKPIGKKRSRKTTHDPTPRGGTKKANVLALLRRSQGATLAEMMKATQWQAHSVRGFLSGALSKKMGLKVKSEKRDDGQRVYSIRG